MWKGLGPLMWQASEAVTKQGFECAMDKIRDLHAPAHDKLSALDPKVSGAGIVCTLPCGRAAGEDDTVVNRLTVYTQFWALFWAVENNVILFGMRDTNFTESGAMSAAGHVCSWHCVVGAVRVNARVRARTRCCPECVSRVACAVLRMDMTMRACRRVPPVPGGPDVWPAGDSGVFRDRLEQGVWALAGSIVLCDDKGLGGHRRHWWVVML